MLMDRYMRGLLDPCVTLLEVHKLMYFMQEAGERLQLKFEERYYGPYANNLRRVLNRMERHYILGYLGGSDAPGNELTLAPGAVDEAYAFLNRYPRTRERLERVFELVEGFESSFGMELLATAHWVSKKHKPKTDEEAIAYTYAWNPRKRQFSERQIRLALRILREKGWIGGANSGS